MRFDGLLCSSLTGRKPRLLRVGECPAVAHSRDWAVQDLSAEVRWYFLWRMPIMELAWHVVKWYNCAVFDAHDVSRQ